MRTEKDLGRSLEKVGRSFFLFYLIGYPSFVDELPELFQILILTGHALTGVILEAVVLERKICPLH